MTQTSIGRRRTHAQHSRAQPAIEPNYHNWYSNIKITFSYCTSTSRRTHNHYIYKYIQKDSSVRPPAKAGGSVFLFSCRLWRAERPRRGRRPASRGLSSAGSVCGRGDRKNLAEASRPAPSPAPRRAPTLYTWTCWHRPPTHTHTHIHSHTAAWRYTTQFSVSVSFSIKTMSVNESPSTNSISGTENGVVLYRGTLSSVQMNVIFTSVYITWTNDQTRRLYTKHSIPSFVWHQTIKTFTIFKYYFTLKLTSY